jgi:DHA1 family putative efflux transporter-like MFS transporter
MNRLAIYVIAIGVFLTATSELVISGIVDIISEDLHISLALAGQLVTVYSLSFAIGTPIVISLTARIGRKKMLLGTLGLFVVGSLLAFISPSLLLLMASRVLLGVSAGVYLVVAFGATARLVPPDKLGGAISTIILGFSVAMIIGVPIGIILSDWMNWHAIFAILGLLTLAVAYFIYRLVPDIEGDAPVSFLKQFKVMGSVVIVSGLFISFFKESGNSAWFTYIIPYMQDELRINPSYSSIIMLVLGLFGAIGSRLGGYGVDRFGAFRMIVASISVHFAVFALLPLFAASTAAALLLVALMVLAMFASGPAIQSYFIQSAPGSSNLVLSLNTSIIHLGLAAGAGGGGAWINGSTSLHSLPWLAGGLLFLGLAAATVSSRYGRKHALRQPEIAQAK